MLTVISSSQWNLKTTTRSGTAKREALWRKYFENPSLWWDNRNSKINSGSPDFKHKITRELLWVHGWFNPPWIHEKLREMDIIRHINGEDAVIASLRACTEQKDLTKGSRIHADVIDKGLLVKSTHVAGAVVNMYAKCGDPERAWQVLSELPARDVVLWNSVIAGYVQHGKGQEALHCMDRMQHENLSPTAVTFACALRACGSVGSIDKGQQIHEEVLKQQLLKNDVVLGNALVDMYAKCGALDKSAQVLHELPVRDVVSWTSLITGYVQQGKDEEALSCIDLMQQEGLSPNSVTFICALQACGNVRAADKGAEIHEEIVRQGLLQNNVILGTALVDMHAKCGAIEKAQEVLNELSARDAILWNALITGYIQQGKCKEALICIDKMQHEGLSPNAVTFECALQACGSTGAVNKGKQIHEEIVRQQLLQNDVVLATALVDMYAKCGTIEKAEEVLHEIPIRDVVSWNAIITAYVEKEKDEEALSSIEQMQLEGLSPNMVTFTCALQACGSIGAADKGEQIHEELVKRQLLQSDVALGTALVDMYAKCSAIEKARQVLREISTANVISWNALITGYTQLGKSEEALMCFDQMQHEGHTPDAVTFLCVLNACSHSGLLAKGQTFFSSMSRIFGITPGIEHHCCMVDLFGRAGEFDKAFSIIEHSSRSEELSLWLALMGACWISKNMEVARLAFQHALHIDKHDASPYLVMRNMYAAAGMHEGANEIEIMRVRNNAWKMPSHQWTDIGLNFNSFHFRDPE